MLPQGEVKLPGPRNSKTIFGQYRVRAISERVQLLQTALASQKHSKSTFNFRMKQAYALANLAVITLTLLLMPAIGHRNRAQ